jgi:hypothetical protein
LRGRQSDKSEKFERLGYAKLSLEQRGKGSYLRKQCRKRKKKKEGKRKRQFY